MPRTAQQKIFIALFSLIVSMGLVWVVASYLFASMDYSLISKQPSPDGKMIIYAFNSHQDGQGHAPYGQILALSHGDKLSQPEDGYVFFAGYCKNPLQYEWHGNDRVSIRCINSQQNGGPRTLASLMYGIKVDYSEPLN